MFSIIKRSKVSDKIKDIMSETIGRIKSMVDVNSVVGTPIKINDKVSVIPISKISYGLGTGGSDFQNKLESGNPFFRFIPRILYYQMRENQAGRSAFRGK